MILDSKPAELREDPYLSWYDGHGKLTWAPASVRFWVTRHRLPFPSDFGTLRVLSVFACYRLEWRLGELPEAVPAESRAQRRGRACWKGLPSGLCPAPPAVWPWRCCCSGLQEGLRRPALSAVSSSLPVAIAASFVLLCTSTALAESWPAAGGSPGPFSASQDRLALGVWTRAEGEQTHRRPQNY